MPLLTATDKKSKKIALTILLESTLFEEVKAYCTWANLNKPREFAAQAIRYVLKNDKEWRKTWIQFQQKNATDLPNDSV